MINSMAACLTISPFITAMKAISFSRGGDSIGGTSDNLTESQHCLEYLDYSPNGSHYIVVGQLTGNLNHMDCLIIDGALATSPDGEPVRRGYSISPMCGGLPDDTWYSFGNPAINNSGDWVTAGTTRTGSWDEYIAYNGVIRVRDGHIIDGVEIDRDLDNLCMNNNGDYAFSATIDSGAGQAIFLNERLLLETGDTIAGGVTLQSIREAGYMTMTDRGTGDIGKIYFIGRVSPDNDYAFIEITVDMSAYFPDCDGNGQDDRVEIAGNPALDCNMNGYLDSCDLASGTSQDCNGNSIPDDVISPADTARTAMATTFRMNATSQAAPARIATITACRMNVISQPAPARIATAMTSRMNATSQAAPARTSTPMACRMSAKTTVTETVFPMITTSQWGPVSTATTTPSRTNAKRNRCRTWISTWTVS